MLKFLRDAVEVFMVLFCFFGLVWGFWAWAMVLDALVLSGGGQ